MRKSAGIAGNGKWSVGIGNIQCQFAARPFSYNRGPRPSGVTAGYHPGWRGNHMHRACRGKSGASLANENTKIVFRPIFHEITALIFVNRSGVSISFGLCFLRLFKAARPKRSFAPHLVTRRRIGLCIRCGRRRKDPLSKLGYQDGQLAVRGYQALRASRQPWQSVAGSVELHGRRGMARTGLERGRSIVR